MEKNPVGFLSRERKAMLTSWLVIPVCGTAHISNDNDGRFTTKNSQFSLTQWTSHIAYEEYEFCHLKQL